MSHEKDVPPTKAEKLAAEQAAAEQAADPTLPPVPNSGPIKAPLLTAAETARSEPGSVQMFVWHVSNSDRQEGDVEAASESSAKYAFMRANDICDKMQTWTITKGKPVPPVAPVPAA